MNKNIYTPHPIDTKDVVLPKELNTLAEDIAKNVHEVWSEGRMKDGWTFGEERNDTEKKHPCLVAYEELSEEEQLALLATDGMLVKRPILVGEDKVLVGAKEKEWEEYLKS